MEYTTYVIPLAYPLIVVQAPRGVVVCGYLNMKTFEETGEAAVMVQGVRSIDDVMVAHVVAWTPAAAALGVCMLDTGESAIRKMQ